MKKCLLIAVFILAIFLWPLSARADIIPENSHSVDLCLKFDNSINNAISGYQLIGYYTGPMLENYEAYKIEADKCLDKGYKFNDFKILAIQKDYLDKVGINNLDLKSNSVLSANISIDPATMTVDNSDPTKSITTTYRVQGISNGQVIIEKVKTVTGYNNGTIDKTETFANQTCMQTSCHDYKTVKCQLESEVKEQICTAVYQIGDRCLKFATCSYNNNQCQQNPSDEFTNCTKCVESCANQGLEAEKLFECEAKCDSSEVIYQGKNKVTSTPTPSPSPTQTSIIDKLIDTGPSFWVISGAALIILIALAIYLGKNKQK